MIFFLDPLLRKITRHGDVERTIFFIDEATIF